MTRIIRSRNFEISLDSIMIYILPLMLIINLLGQTSCLLSRDGKTDEILRTFLKTFSKFVTRSLKSNIITGIICTKVDTSSFIQFGVYCALNENCTILVCVYRGTYYPDSEKIEERKTNSIYECYILCQVRM